MDLKSVKLAISFLFLQSGNSVNSKFGKFMWHVMIRVHLKGYSAQRSYMLALLKPPEGVTSLPSYVVESIHALGE